MPASSPFVPFDFEQRRKQDKTIGEVRTFDPVSDVVGRMREAEQRDSFLSGEMAPAESLRYFRSQLFGRDPEREARVTKLSRRVGEPPALIEGREDTFDRYLRASAFQRSVATNPELSRFFGNNPRYAVAASDDAKSIGMVGEAWDTISKGPAALKAGFIGLGGQGARINWWLANDVFGPTWDFLSTIGSPNTLTVGEMEKRKADRLAYWTAGVSGADASQKQARPQYRGPIQEGLLQGIESVPLSLGATAVGVATRNPYAAVAMMGGVVGGAGYTDARLVGRDPATSFGYGYVQGVTESITELAPESTLLNAVASKTGIAKTLFKYLGHEIPGEMTATLVQSYSDFVTLNTEKTVGDWVASLPRNEAMTVLGVLSGGTVHIGATRGLGALMEKLGQWKQARRNAGAIDQLGKAAEASELRRRDPEAYRELIRHMGEKSGASHVFVPADVVQEYMQSDSYDVYNDPFEEYRDQVDEAVATGGDVVLPVDFALGVLPGTSAWAAVKDDMRLASAGMSAREAAHFEDSMDEVESELETLAKEGSPDKTEELTQRLQEKLQDAGFTPYVARQQATLMVNRIVTRAARLGNDVTGAEGDYLDIRQVLPPELAKARAADTLDLVINALRKGGEATKQSGQSLLEFIASRGGIEDRGGDLASMGGDKWHRAAPFRKKLLKKFDAAQGSMIGGEYNPNSIGSMFDAAVSAGYFPDLLVQREEGSGYSDALDANAFIDAIGEELAGNPRYAEEAQTDHFRAAADELRQALSERGLDPEGLSDDELRAIVAQMGEAQDGAGFDQLPDTIEIDGAQRPTRNSEGQQIAGTEEGVRAFWKWFGDSKVVDDQGRPLVVYHGGRKGLEVFDPAKAGEVQVSDWGKGVYFTPRQWQAQGYANDAQIASDEREKELYQAITDTAAKYGVSDPMMAGIKLGIGSPEYADVERATKEWRDYRAQVREQGGGEVYPAYLKIENPEVYQYVGITDPYLAGQAKANDRDGVIVVNEEVTGPLSDHMDEILVFDPTQIKSINNRGTFDPGDARILYQRTGIDLSAGGGSKSISIGDATIKYGVSSNGETAEVILVSVPKAKRRGGAARKAMQEFLAATDAAGLTVFLTAHPMGKGGASKTALEKFYKSLGFVENKGRNKDFRAMQGMVRQPPRILYQSAYHGSPHIFDKFSLDYMGTGEGQQAYGWGLYFAGRKEIAEHYRNTLTLDVGFDYAGKTGLNRAEVQNLVNMKYGGRYLDNVARASGVADKVMDDLIYGGKNNYKEGSERRAVYDEIAAELKRPENTGRLYEVEIPEDNEYLLWDKPLSEQSGDVRKGFEKALAQIDSNLKEVAEIIFDDGDVNKLTGQRIYEKMKDLIGPERSKLEATIGDLAWGRTDQIASMLLHNAGIAGIKFLDGTSRSQGEGSYNYVVFDDSRVSIQAYEQSYGDGPRGRIQFIPDGRSIIELFKDRNLSTLLHELGHDYLEQLRVDAPQSEQLTADLQAVYDWFKANGHEVTDGVIPVEAHELWARGFERYLMEGKAPSQGLQRIFETFRGWLTAIYKKVAALRSPITPEIREVMDRLLATDEEIAAMREQQMLEPLFKDAASIGMTDAEFQAYTDDITRSRHAASGALLEKTMAAIRARETKRYKEARAEVEREVADQVDNVPLFRAMRHMKAGKVDAVWLEREMGKDAKSLLPKGTVKEGGLHPDAIAEISGFDSGKQMIEAVMGAEAQHRQLREEGDKRSMRDRAIQTATDTEMNRRYGDPLSDGSIEREALAAVHSEKQGEVFAAEARALARKTGQRPTPYRMARDWARRKVREGVYQTEASAGAIQRHQRNVAKAGREAEKAMLAGKFEDALRFKQQQMVSSALLAEAKLANDEVEAARKRLANISKNRKRETIDQDYWDQAQAVLAGYEFIPQTQKLLAERERFEEWAAREQEAGHEIQVPERLAAPGTNYTRMTTEQIIGIDDMVSSILHLGRQKKSLKVGKNKRDWREARGEWLDRAEALPDRPQGTDRNAKSSKVRGIISSMIRVDMMAKIMDDGDPNGLMTSVLAYGSKEADTTYARIQSDVLAPLLDEYMALDGKRLFNRITVPEWIDYKTGGPTTFLRSDLFAIALNLGTESNMRKMLAGEALLFKGQEHLAPTEQGVMQALYRELNEAEWKFIERAWRQVDSMFPELAAVERELTGLTPEKVEPRMVVTPYGEIEGGYWPVAYDTDAVRAAAAGVNLEEIKSSDMDVALGLTGRGVRTNKGHTISRTDFVAPVLLNFEGVLFGHVNQVAKRIAYQAWATQALKLIRDPRIKAMWSRKLGPEYHKQLEPWLRDTVNQGAIADQGHLADFNGILKRSRMTLTIMGLVGRLTTMIAQVGGLTSSMNAIGANNVANGLRIAAADYGAMKARVFEASSLMARRLNEFDRDQAAALAEIQSPPRTAVGRALKPLANARDKWNALGFHMIGAIQLHLVDLPTWAGAYAQAMAPTEQGGLDLDHDEAVNYADLKVEQAQGAGRTAQLAAVQRNGEAAKILTLFYTFFGTQLNYQWEMTQDVRRGKYGKAAKSAFWIMVVTPLISGLMADAVRGALPDGDDDDTWLAWALRKIFFGMFTGLPIIRDFANTAERKMSGKYAPDPQTPWQRLASGVGGGLEDAFAGVSQTSWYREAENAMPFLPDAQEPSEAWLKHAIEALGFATGTGLGQVATTAEFAADVSRGEQRPRDAADWVQGVATGKVDDD